MNFKNVFVTVGTTKFDDLIKTVTSPNTLKVCYRTIITIVSLCYHFHEIINFTGLEK